MIYDIARVQCRAGYGLGGNVDSIYGNAEPMCDIEVYMGVKHRDY